MEMKLEYKVTLIVKSQLWPIEIEEEIMEAVDGEQIEVMSCVAD